MSLTRRTRLVLFLVAVPVLLLLLLIAAAFLPAVQTGVARRVLASEGGSLERVAVGLGGAELNGFALQRPGLRVSVPDLRADVPILDAAGGRIAVLGLVAQDIEVEFDPVAYAAAAPAQPTPTAEPPTPFAGVLSSLVLPANLTVDGIDLTGRVRVVGAQAADLTFALRGGGLRAGQGAEFVFEAQVRTGADEVKAKVVLSPALDAQGQIEALGAALDALASSPRLAAPASLRAEARIDRSGTGETYLVKLADAQRVLLQLEQTWSPAAATTPGAWQISLRDADLTAFVPGAVLPPFSIEGAGQAALLDLEKLTLAGRVALRADRLESLRLPGLDLTPPALGPVAVETTFAASGSSRSLLVENFSLTVAGAKPVLSIETTQPVTLTETAPFFSTPRPSDALAKVALLGVPPAWLSPFVPDLALTGPVTGAWTVRANGQDLAIESSAPFQIGAFRYGPSGQPLAELDAVRIGSMSVSQGAQGLSASLREISVTAGARTLASAELQAAQAPGQALVASGRLSADLAAALAQPAARGASALTAGTLDTRFEATLAEPLAVRAELKLSDLRAPGATSLPEVETTLAATYAASGALSVNAPVSIKAAKGARVSDLRLAADLAPRDGGYHLVGKLDSTLLHVSDLETFAALAPTSTPASPPASANPSAPAAVPASAPGSTPWSGFTGGFELALAKVVLTTPAAIELQNIAGKLVLTPEAATLEGLGVGLGTGGRLDLSGSLRRPAAADGYALSAGVSATDLAVGPLLRLLQGGEPPVDGIYQLKASLTGAGSDPAAAAQAATLKLDLTGREGRLRALKLDTNRYVRAGGTVATLAGFAGALSGNNELSQRAAQITALQNLARRLSDLPYDELAVRLQGAAAGPVQIERLALASPQLRIEGAGGLDFSPGLTWANRPLNLQLQLGAREDFATLLETLRVLKPAAATEDYRALIEPLVLDGTLRQVGTDQITRLFTRALGL